MVEADPTQTDRVVTAFHKFVSLANTMLHSGEGLEDWARTRWEDFVIMLQWCGHDFDYSFLKNLRCPRLYDFHPDGQEDILLDTMMMLKWMGDPWESVFDPQVSLGQTSSPMQKTLIPFVIQYFPQGPVESLENPFPVLTWHGVNMAEGLKALPATYRFTHNQSGMIHVFCSLNIADP